MLPRFQRWHSPRRCPPGYRQCRVRRQSIRWGRQARWERRRSFLRLSRPRSYRWPAVASLAPWTRSAVLRLRLVLQRSSWRLLSRQRQRRDVLPRFQKWRPPLRCRQQLHRRGRRRQTCWVRQAQWKQCQPFVRLSWPRLCRWPVLAALVPRTCLVVPRLRFPSWQRCWQQLQCHQRKRWDVLPRFQRWHSPRRCPLECRQCRVRRRFLGRLIRWGRQARWERRRSFLRLSRPRSYRWPAVASLAPWTRFLAPSPQQALQLPSWQQP